jgi:hypothetical protein
VGAGNIPAEANRSSIMTLLPDVGYLADTPLATNGSLRRAFNSALRPSALTVRLEDGRPLVWKGRSVSSGSDNLFVSAGVVAQQGRLTGKDQYPHP